MKKLLRYAAVGAMLAALAPAADAQILVPGDGVTIAPLGGFKTWTAENGNTFTQTQENLNKIIASPTNTENIYLFPEVNGPWNTEANRTIGIQGVYIDMGAKKDVGVVMTTWEGACAGYSLWLSDTEPTAVPTAAPIATVSKATENTTALPAGSKGRYLILQPNTNDVANFAWGVKIRSISALAPYTPELTTFTVTPGFAPANQTITLNYTFKDQIGLNIAASDVTVTASSNATLNGNQLTINSGNKATLTAKMGTKTVTATVFAPAAPALPDAAEIKTPIFTNTVTADNAYVDWGIAYNGGATNYGTVVFPEGEVAQAFGPKAGETNMCIFFSNSRTTGAWDADMNAEGWKTLNLSIYGTKAVTGKVMYERPGTFSGEQEFTLVPGEWTNVVMNIQGESNIHTLSVRFADVENLSDILLTNIYFTPLYIDGDIKAPTLENPTATANYTSATLTLQATDDMNPYVNYLITYTNKDNNRVTRTFEAKSGVRTTYTVDDLSPNKEYAFSVVATDGKNKSNAKEVKISTYPVALPAAPSLRKGHVVAVYSPAYEAAAVPTFNNWDSKGEMSTVEIGSGDNKENALFFTNYAGQWGGLENLDKDVKNMTKLHIDIFSTSESGTVVVAPVWKDKENTPSKNCNVIYGQWKSFDINLSDFDMPEENPVAAALAINSNVEGSTVQSFIVDNIYFYNDTPEVIMNVTLGKFSDKKDGQGTVEYTVKVSGIDVEDVANYVISTDMGTKDAIVVPSGDVKDGTFQGTIELSNLPVGQEVPVTVTVTAYPAVGDALGVAEAKVNCKSEAAPSGIDAIDAENSEVVIYNLQGIRVSKAVKGQIYIMNGKKVRF